MWYISKTADCRAKWIIGRRAKGKLWHFDIFLTHKTILQLEISKCYFHDFSHKKFSLEPSRLYDNIGYHGKSKCLLEYCK